MMWIRRLLLGAILTMAAFVAPALVGTIAHAGADDWVCVGAQAIGGGYCLSDPMPDELPIP